MTRDIDTQCLYDLVARAYETQLDSPEIAILSAQMAVETCAERCFEELLLHRGLGALVEPLVACVPDRSFQDARSRRLWTALTDTQISKAPTWKAYDSHVELRNTVAHRGARVTPEDALNSCEACRGLVTFMLEALTAATGEDHCG
jgi:hypothetical protein